MRSLAQSAFVDKDDRAPLLAGFFLMPGHVFLRQVRICSPHRFRTKRQLKRTRDKMSAARRKGKWVGGCPVLGYDVDPGGGRLVVNEEEAERVRAIFALFEEHGSARPTLAEIERRGWRLKSWTLQTGQFRAGGPFALNSLRRLLTNILCTGAIRHKGQPYPGEHAAILTPGTWERVQNLITHRAALAHGKSRNKHLALLSGLLYCESCGTRMVYSYSGKNDRKYPYYVCLNAQHRGDDRARRPCGRNRISASCRDAGRDPLALRGRLHSGHLGDPVLDEFVKTGMPTRAEITDGAMRDVFFVWCASINGRRSSSTSTARTRGHGFRGRAVCAKTTWQVTIHPGWNLLVRRSRTPPR
jgi:hypothetical protein